MDHTNNIKTIDQQIRQEIANAVSGSFDNVSMDIEHVSLEHPAAEEHGDYSTNVALQLAKKLNLKPREVAEKILKVLQQNASENQSNSIKSWDKVEIAGPGFINFWLTKERIIEELEAIKSAGSRYGQGAAQAGKKVMVEYGHPNTHKEMHIGHMRTLITGESLARILEFSGATVFRANYQGDIGPHVAKAIWGTTQLLKEEGSSWDQADSSLNLKEKSHLLGQGYIRGSQEYEAHKDEINSLNKQLYAGDSNIEPIYQLTRKWSLDYYDDFYARFSTKFDHFFFESQVAAAGKKLVEDNIGKVFEKSDGAIIFDGEPLGLHKRVFVTSEGNPTYEGKELALASLEFSEFSFDLCVHVVANEQAGYFQVVIKALELLDPKFVGREFHLSMGMVNLVGKKISSRTGVIITVDSLIDDVKELLQEKIKDNVIGELRETILEAATIGAVKYSVLKSGPLVNATFDLEKSVSLDGDSGPYIQYTYARAQSVLRKAEEIQSDASKNDQLVDQEIALLRWLYRFPEVVELSAKQFTPNLIATYLFELAKRFNAFYAEVPILHKDVDPIQAQFRLKLTEATSVIIKNGLNLLGIEALERM